MGWLIQYCLVLNAVLKDIFVCVQRYFSSICKHACACVQHYSFRGHAWFLLNHALIKCVGPSS